MIKITDLDTLIVVDVQRDFLPSGALPVPKGDKIIGILNEYIRMFNLMSRPIFATRDWHPKNHISFKENGGLWPRHCVQNTDGAKFAENLELPPNTFIINKGDRPELEAYSGFQGTLLNSLLRERGIKRVFIGGLATDYCVKQTIIGAINLGYVSFFLKDASKAVSDGSSAEDEMLRRGAVSIDLSMFL